MTRVALPVTYICTPAALQTTRSHVHFCGGNEPGLRPGDARLRIQTENDLIIKLLRQSIKNRRVSTFIVSFPKSGRTWLRVMIGRVLAEVYGVDEDRMLSTYKASRSAGVPPVLFSHGGPFHLMDEGPFTSLTLDRRVFSAKRVLFLTRDLRDTLVSYYFQQGKREHVFEGGMHEFLRDERFGARKLVRFLTLWFQNQDAPASLKLIRYEDMQLNAQATLAGVLDFLGWQGIDQAAVKGAVEYGSFDNMKAMEAAGQFNRKMMRPGDPKDADSFKVRKGKIGGFSAYLDEEDLAYIDEVIQSEGDPACDWYLWNEM